LHPFVQYYIAGLNKMLQLCCSHFTQVNEKNIFALVLGVLLIRFVGAGKNRRTKTG
jgi:hypothetical protein